MRSLYSLIQRVSVIAITIVFQECSTEYRNEFLDYAIPRVVTPHSQIATVRTKWWNGKLRQTSFLDRQGRVLEEFNYGRTNEKILNRYADNRLISRLYYYHSNSVPAGYVSLTKSRYEYDEYGRVKRALNVMSSLQGNGSPDVATSEHIADSGEVCYQYRGLNDTIVSYYPAVLSPSGDVYIDRWERNRNGQLSRHFKLNVLPRIGSPGNRIDTMTYYSHRFSYDTFGRLKRTWYDLMYMGDYYLPAGPDTTDYRYDEQNRLTREVHKYTLDMGNKREVDTTRLSKFDRESITSHRITFISGKSWWSNKIDTVIYRYEPFNPKKHLPLQISTDIGY